MLLCKFTPPEYLNTIILKTSLDSLFTTLTISISPNQILEVNFFLEPNLLHNFIHRLIQDFLLFTFPFSYNSHHIFLVAVE